MLDYILGGWVLTNHISIKTKRVNTNLMKVTWESSKTLSDVSLVRSYLLYSVREPFVMSPAYSDDV